MCRLQAAADDAVDEDNFRSGPVFISGASGNSAAAMNGYYEPTLWFGMDGREVSGDCMLFCNAPLQSRVHWR